MVAPARADLEAPVSGWSDDEGPRARERATRTRRALLLAASHRFDREGYDAASLRTIVDDARVTKGALYFHFASKAELAEAVVLEVDASWCRLADVVAARALDPIWRLLVETDAAVARWMFDPVVRGGYRVLTDSQVLPSRRSSLMRAWEHHMAGLVDQARTAGLTRPGVEPAGVARTIHSLVCGHHELEEAIPDHADTPAFWDRMSDSWRSLLPTVATQPWVDEWVDSAWGARAAPSARAYATARRP